MHIITKYNFEARHKCKHDFPMKKRMVSQAKVVCRGNARRFGLRPSGRRNALGTILTRRICKWRSGCSPAMALVFRCNTHTAPNFRILFFLVFDGDIRRIASTSPPSVFLEGSGDGKSTIPIRNQEICKCCASEGRLEQRRPRTTEN